MLRITRLHVGPQGAWFMERCDDAMSSDLDYDFEQTMRFDSEKTIRAFTSGHTTFKRFELRKVLGRGGMGVVWLARDRELDRDVALKFLPDILSADPVAVSDLKREVRRAIAHPHIVQIFDFVTDGLYACISMQFVEGKTLAELRLGEPQQVFAPQRLLPWIKQLCDALDYAHSKAGVVHRDLKPANIMIDAANDVKILDFGIAASIHDNATRVSRHVLSCSPSYASPQQFRGNVLPDPSDDFYALGVTLYELLTGKPPFQGGNLAHAILHETPMPLNARRPTGAEPVPVSWEKTIATLLAKNPVERPKSGFDAVARFEETGRRTRRPKKPACSTRKISTILYFALLSLVVIIGIAASFFKEIAPKPQTPPRVASQPVVPALTNTNDTIDRKRIETERMREKSQQDEKIKIAGEQSRLIEQKRQAEERRRTTARGGVLVRTRPAGAEVILGSFAAEKSPLTVRGVKLGKIPLHIRLLGYETYDGELEVKENEFSEASIDLVRSEGMLTIESEPAGVDYEIRGETIRHGKTPAAEQLPTGKYEVVFSRREWTDRKKTVEIKREQTEKVSAQFVAGQLVIESIPRGATVRSSGGKVLGQTPLLLRDVEPGKLSFTLELSGFRRCDVQCVLEAHGMVSVRAELLPLTASRATIRMVR